jgi:Flp pilus assembly protein TadG
MGFAVDLGRLYLVKGELNQAASAMAMAAARQLNGTDQAVDAAGGAAQSLLDDSLHDASRYNFGSIVIGQPTLSLTSTVAEPALFATVADAIAAAGQTGAASTADGTTARHVTINMNADAPLLFWSLLTLGQSRHVSVAATAVAGISAPLCTACGIEPFAIAPIDSSDPTNFGFTQDTIYTFGYQCTGAQPAVLAGSTVRVPYLMIDRYDTGQALDEPSQAFRIGAGGLPADATVDTNSTPSSVTYECLRITNAENVWANAPTRACATPPPTVGIAAMCGLSARLTDPTTTAACTSAADISALAGLYAPDVSLDLNTAYASYTGNNRRLITVPVVDALSSTTVMTVLGFRQFLIQPLDASGTANNPSDVNSRFIAMYAGVVAPVRQGRFDGSCGATSGPGKVVLHQ